MSFTTLISSADLAPHVTDADWAVVDCRFDLAQPEWGEGQYQAAHIPGARFVGYPSGGHLLVGHQEAVTSEIVAFLR